MLVPCGKSRSPYPSKAQEPQEQRYWLLSVCAVIFSVQTMLWLPAFGICNVRAHADVCDCTRGLYGHRKRVCTGSRRWEKNLLPHLVLKGSSVLHLAFQSNALPAEPSPPPVDVNNANACFTEGFKNVVCVRVWPAVSARWSWTTWRSGAWSWITATTTAVLMVRCRMCTRDWWRFPGLTLWWAGTRFFSSDTTRHSPFPGRFLTEGIYSFVNCQIVCIVHYRFLFNMTLFSFFITWHLITVRTFSVWCLPTSEHLVFGTCLFQNTKYLVPASFKTQSIW